MSDIPTKTYPPSVLRAMIDEMEAERAEATGDVTPTPEESSAVPTPPKTYCRETAELIRSWDRRARYHRAIDALRDKLVKMKWNKTVPMPELRDSVVELLDALLDMETDGGTR